MGSAPSQLNQAGELKVFQNTSSSRKTDEAQKEFDLETDKTNSRILVSITKENTVRISEGKSTATQTGEESRQPSAKNQRRLENENNKTENATKMKEEKFAQTDLSIFETKIQNECEELENVIQKQTKPETPSKTPDGVKSVCFDESALKQERKQETARSLNWPESETEAWETDYWTDIGIQTDDDFDEYFGPRVAWGSKSVDSAKTLQENTGQVGLEEESEKGTKEANDGEEKETDTRSDDEGQLEVGPFHKLTLERYGKYKVRLSSDKENCIVSSAAFLETGDAVVIDRSNLKLKYVDRKFQYISSYELPVKPWGVCARGVDIYVTMGNTKVQHFVVGQDMIIEPVDVFEIKGRCLGICTFGENLVVGLQIGELCLLNFKGEKTGTIQLPKINGKTSNPWHLCATSEENLLVTDSDAGAIYCVNKKSELIFTFREMGSPRGTAIDTDGNILVVGRDKETGAVVSMLHKDMELQSMLHIQEGIKITNRTLMTWEELEFVPYCVCFRPDRVVVLGGIQEAIKIMTLR